MSKSTQYYWGFAQMSATFAVIILLALIPLIGKKPHIQIVSIFDYKFYIEQFLWGATLLFSLGFSRYFDKVLDDADGEIIYSYKSMKIDDRVRSFGFWVIFMGWVSFNVALLLIGLALDILPSIIISIVPLLVIAISLVLTKSLFKLC